MKITVTEADLIGELEGIPLEVFQKMLERQFEQHNRCNMTVFQRGLHAGFNWGDSPEGKYFWRKVIIERDFDVFFDRYPKQSQPQKYTMREAYRQIKQAERRQYQKQMKRGGKARLVHQVINARSWGHCDVFLKHYSFISLYGDALGYRYLTPHAANIAHSRLRKECGNFLSSPNPFCGRQL